MRTSPRVVAAMFWALAACQPARDDPPEKRSEDRYGRSSHPEPAAQQLSENDLTGRFCWLMKDSAALVRVRIQGWAAAQDVSFPSVGVTYRMSPVTVGVEETLIGPPQPQNTTILVGDDIQPSGAFVGGELGDADGGSLGLAYVRSVDGMLVLHTQGWFGKLTPGSAGALAADGGSASWSEAEIVDRSLDPLCPPTPWK